MQGRGIIVCVFFAVLALALPAGVSQITPDILPRYVVNQSITGSIAITLTNPIPDNSTLDVYIGDSLEAAEDLAPYLDALKPYSYALKFFNYTITAMGNLSANGTPWDNSTKIENRSCRYMENYTINYTAGELETMLGVPGDLENLTYSVAPEPQENLYASLAQNPDGNYTLAVYTNSTEFSSPLDISLALDDLNITAPEGLGDYNITFEVKNGSIIYFRETQVFGTCPDNDNDGYALEGSGCQPEDCNDKDAGINPNATEVCNEIDDNCDGLVDNVGGGNSTETTRCRCFGGATPATETCNGIDDDCDGTVDGMSRLCSLNYLGECSAGTETCTLGIWLGCPGPEEEICDEKDNDCNGEVDDGVINTCTDYSTCETYSTCNPCPSPPAEVCNGLDDNCNDEADEGFECASGETRACNSNIGVCVEGTMTCSECSWGTCEGSYGPFEEICDNGLDDDCDAEPDEDDCIRDVNIPCPHGMISDSCRCGGNPFSFGYCCNDEWGLKKCGFDFGDIGIWLIIGGAAILVVLSIVALRFRGKGRVTWEELYSRWR